MYLSKDCRKLEAIPDEIQRATEHDRCETERRITAFPGAAEGLFQHHESARYHAGHYNENEIPHLVLGRGRDPGWADADPEKRNESKWRAKEYPCTGEQPAIFRSGSERPCTQNPDRNRDRCKIRYSGGLIDSWDAKGAHAGDNEAKKRDDAEKDVAHAADGIHWDLLIN